MGQDAGWKAGHVAIQGIGSWLAVGVTQEFFLEGASQPLTGQQRGCLARKGQIADDDADAGAVQGFGNAVIECTFACMQQKLEQGVQAGQLFLRHAESGQVGKGWDVFYEAAAARVDPVRLANLWIVCRVRGEEPPACRHFADRASAGTDGVPEAVEVRRIGIDAADTDNGY